MDRKSKSSGAPRTDDTFVAGERPVARRSGPFAQQIDQYLNTLYASGNDAEQRHAEALDALRRNAGESVIALAKAGACCHKSDYPRRWALVYAAAKMEHDAALPYFRELVLAPIPDPHPRGGHGFSAAREETILRTTAIEGVGRLAERGNGAALQALYEFLDIPSISVRRATIQAVLKVDPKARGKLAKRLPSDCHHLLDVRTIPVKKAPQVKNPRAHLRSRRPPDKPAPPAVPDAQADDTSRDDAGKRSKRRGPRVGGK
jgi:hypothetical protein